MRVADQTIDDALAALAKVASREDVPAARLLSAMANAIESPIERHYRVSELADFLSVDRRTVNRWIETKALRAVDLNDQADGRPQWRVAHGDLEAFLAAQRRRPRRRKVRSGSPIVQKGKRPESSSSGRRRLKNTRPKKHLV